MLADQSPASIADVNDDVIDDVIGDDALGMFDGSFTLSPERDDLIGASESGVSPVGVSRRSDMLRRSMRESALFDSLSAGNDMVEQVKEEDDTLKDDTLTDDVQDEKDDTLKDDLHEEKGVTEEMMPESVMLQTPQRMMTSAETPGSMSRRQQAMAMLAASSKEFDSL